MKSKTTSAIILGTVGIVSLLLILVIAWTSGAFVQHY
jgi:DMSO/TMAO reductase YedYZ heme-binding membrane subunit